MSEDSEAFLAKHRSQIEQKLREQIARHQRVDPAVERKRIIEIVLRQEREQLERLRDRSKEAGRDDVADLYDLLIDDWLPDLERQLKLR
jgi:hypothetical protein